MSPVSAALRVVLDTAAYRLKQREAGNLVTSLTLALALSLPVRDLAVRFTFGVVLNLFVYLVNDLLDVHVDLRAPGREQARVQFLAEHLREGWAAVAVLTLAAAALAAWHSAGLVASLAATAVIIPVYTRFLKRVPLADLGAMTAWGFSMALVGAPLDSPAGLRFAGLLAILCTITEAVQVLRDHDSDHAAGVRTTAVALGPRATAWVARALVVGAAAYASLCLSRHLGALFLLGLLVPLSAARAAKSWDAFRLVFGVSWLALLAHYHRLGRLDGWLG